MAKIEANTHIEAPISRVWEVLVDWEGQARWMVDARSVEVRTSHREGNGVVVRCRTDLLGLVVTDDMIVTDWQPERLIAVRHLGRIIRGIGAFELTPTEHGTHFLWWEEAQAPLGALGEALATVAVVPFSRRLFRASLANLKLVCEARSVRPPTPPGVAR